MQATQSPLLSGVSEPLLLTLYLRASETQRPDGLLRDQQAVAMLKQIDYDWSRIHLQRHDAIALVLRINKIDSLVRAFLQRTPPAAVVHLGCGLDTRFERVDDGRVEWFDLDLPPVIALRQQLIHRANPRCHPLAASVFDEDWLDEVERFKPRPLLFVAEGVLPYFEAAQVKALFARLSAHFPGCELVTDARSPVGVWTDNLHLKMSHVAARMHWGLKAAQDVEAWDPGYRLLEEWYYFDDPASPLKDLRWVRHIPGLAKASGIFHFRLGGLA